MRRKTDNDALLQDVFAEAAPANLREAMLGESVRLVRRRRSMRRMTRATGLFIALGLAAILMRYGVPHHSGIMSKNKPGITGRNYTLVRTQPLPETAIVSTQPLATGQLVGMTGTVGIVETKHDAYRVIDDQELLSLASARPCVLVQLSPGSEKLVFVNPDDAKGFPVQ